MKNWLRKLLGIDVIDETISENNRLLQSKLEDISEQMTTSSVTLSQLDELTTILVSDKKQERVPILEPATKIQMGGNFGSLDFRLNNDFKLDEKWVFLNSSDQISNIMSQAVGVTAVAGASMYSASGLYTATAPVEQLMKYSDGSLGSARMVDGKIVGHSGFVGANAAVFAPIIIFQLASMATGQYYFNGLSKQLTSLHKSINTLISLHHNERLAKLRYINSKIAEINNRSFYTTEDYITINKLKYDLSVIRFEYLLTASQEIEKSFDKVILKDDSVIEVNSVDTNALEKTVLSIKEKATRLTSYLGDKFNDLYEDSAAQKAISGIKNFTENSSSKAEKLAREILESKFFFYSDTALKAEHLYQLSKLLEFKMNLSDKNPDANRIGKINELFKSISDFNTDDSIFDEIESLNRELRTKLLTDFDNLKDNSVVNKNKIMQLSENLKSRLDHSDDLIAQKEFIFNDVRKIKEGFEKPIQIAIDNRHGKAELFTKSLFTDNS